MKNYVKWLGIIAIVVVIGFSITACQTDDNDGGGNNGGGSAFIGAKLELSGQVYTMIFNNINNTITYPEYKGNLIISDDNGGTATITNGKISYTIETPKNLETWDDFENSFFYINDNATTSDSSVKYFKLGGFYTHDANTHYSLHKQNIAINIGNTSSTYTYEYLYYVYVDKDVTISGKGKTSTYTEDGCTYTNKSNNFNLALKKGWNVIYSKNVNYQTYPAGNPNVVTSVTNTHTISLENPSIKWVLEINSDD